MKLPKKLIVKETTKLFANEYKYKVVLICYEAGWFRNKNYDLVRTNILRFSTDHYFKRYTRIDSARQLNFIKNLLDTLTGFEIDSYGLRVEHPYVSVYTNDESQVQKLCRVDLDHVKFVSKPFDVLEPNTIKLKTIDFGYKVTMAGTRNRDHSNFVNWASNNPKIRLTNSCMRDLKRTYSWGGSYFYAKDDKTLTMVKMFLGSDIMRVDKVIKA